MLKVFELFAGVGAPRMALDVLKEKCVLDYESLGYSEIDKYAFASYKAIHNDDNNFGDITKIEELPKGIDILFHGSPCQDFSLAGKGLGAVEGTRSNLMFETVRLVEKALPKIIVWENVKGVLTKKHKHSFDNYVEKLSNLGYTSHYKVINAKDHGIAQNRERIFCVSFLNDTSGFAFPKSKELTTCLRDYLDDYFTDDDVMWDPKDSSVPRGFEWCGRKNVIAEVDAISYKSDKRISNAEKYVDCLKASDCNKNSTKKVIDVIANVENRKHSQSSAIHNTNKSICTLTACDFKSPQKCFDGIVIPSNTKQGYVVAQNGDGVDLTIPSSKTRRGRVQHQSIHTLTTQGNLAACVNNEKYQLVIRKLKPIEYWRLMGFTDENFNKAKEVCSNSQLYKQAGNSIVVNVLVDLIECIVNRQQVEESEKEMTIFDFLE